MFADTSQTQTDARHYAELLDLLQRTRYLPSNERLFVQRWIRSTLFELANRMRVETPGPDLNFGLWDDSWE